MVVNQQPAAIPLCKQVGGESLSGFNTIPEAVGNIFKTTHPGQGAFNSHGDIAKLDTDLARVPEDAFPALRDIFPPDDQAPARMNALYPLFMQPHLGHL